MPNRSLKHRPKRPHYDTYKAKAEALKRLTAKQNLPCWLCGQPIDTSLNWKHAMSFTADHVIPIANGGKVNGELRPAHRSCNSRKSNKAFVKFVRPPKQVSRKW